jgi:signal transduction histidine kinase
MVGENQELDALRALSRAVDGVSPPDERYARGALEVVNLAWAEYAELWRRGDGWASVVGYGPEPAGEHPRAAAVASVVAAGRIVQRQPWTLIPIDEGALLALWRARRASESFLQGVAEVTALAVQRGRLHAHLLEQELQRRRALQALLGAQEEERKRIARDLHDQIGQPLTAIALGIDRLQESPDPQALTGLRSLAVETLDDVRRIALALRPALLDELGLAAALQRFGRDQQARYGVPVNVLVQLPQRLPPVEETVLYRVAQEALTNVVRHAGAEQVSVVVTQAGGGVRLVVEDDGVGFDPERISGTQSLGIAGMRERLELLGGDLRLETAPGAGCTVHARIPL